MKITITWREAESTVPISKLKATASSIFESLSHKIDPASIDLSLPATQDGEFVASATVLDHV